MAAALNLLTGNAESTAGAIYDPSVTEGISLVSGGDSAAVVTAGENTGLGQNTATWAAEATTLTVPGSIATAGEAHSAVINWYNNIRPHGALNYLTPKEYKENFYKNCLIFC